MYTYIYLYTHIYMYIALLKMITCKIWGGATIRTHPNWFGLVCNRALHI